MLLSDIEAQSKWCPFVRVNGSNRLAGPDAFPSTDKDYHCIGTSCMAWRSPKSVEKHGNEEPGRHGYCGVAGRAD